MSNSKIWINKKKKNLLLFFFMIKSLLKFWKLSFDVYERVRYLSVRVSIIGWWRRNKKSTHHFCFVLWGLGVRFKSPKYLWRKEKKKSPYLFFLSFWGAQGLRVPNIYGEKKSLTFWGGRGLRVPKIYEEKKTKNLLPSEKVKV